MTTGRLEQMREIFGKVRQLPPEQRQEFLEQACGGDAGLVAEIQELLEGDRPATISLGPKTRLPNPPKTIGPYRILSVLGEGGMGLVYKGEQTDPLHRVAAIKVVRPGFSSRSVIARFESERNSLAMMDHPNIAKVYEAGTTDAGEPYFAMEFVPGQPITQFADQHKLTTAQRLRLFLQACEAVGHAHGKLVIHRDIKASNVLAYLQDGQVALKVIDFGVAKALAGETDGASTLHTQAGGVLGTYEYMSPEQAGGAPDIDTRTDVYSLGVLLYELLTGARPFDKRVLSKAADDEIRRIIREVEPPRPSTRLFSLAGDATAVAQVRQTEVQTLVRELRHELEWIPLMAMRKERERRYTSPLQLAEDVRNYLEGRALIAGPESNTYRIRKFVAKRKVPVLMSAAAIVLLVAGTIGTTLGFLGQRRLRFEADRQKTEALAANAEAEKERVKAVAARDEAEKQKGMALAAKVEADSQRASAVAAKDEAENHRREAEGQKASAVASKIEADKQRAIAEELRSKAEQALKDLEHANRENGLIRGRAAALESQGAWRKLAMALELARNPQKAGAIPIKAAADAMDLWQKSQARAAEAQAKHDSKLYDEARSQWEQARESADQALALVHSANRIEKARKDFDDVLTEINQELLAAYAARFWPATKAAADKGDEAAARGDEAAALAAYAEAQRLLRLAQAQAEIAYGKTQTPQIVAQVAEHLKSARSLRDRGLLSAAFDEVRQALTLNAIDPEAKDFRAELLRLDDLGDIVLGGRIEDAKLDKVPLSQAIDRLHRATKVDVSTDWQALEKSGIQRTMLVTLDLRKVTAGQAFTALCSELSQKGAPIACEYDSRTIVISTLEQIASRTTTVTYVVGDLVAGENPKTMADFAGLVKRSVAPDSWAAGRIGSIRTLKQSPGSLIITQDRANHWAIAEFLRKLRDDARPQP